MSLIITVWTTEGIVMGSDSRISFSSQIAPNIPVNIQMGHYFDTQEKTFLCPNNCGISTCGAASLQNKNITGYIYDYIDNQVTATTSTYDTANNLKNHIISIDPNAEVHFIVAGYDLINGQKIQSVYQVITGPQNICNQISSNGTGAKWDGEIDTITRIVKAHYMCQNPIDVPILTLNTANGSLNVGDSLVLPKNQTIFLGENVILWTLMTLQDAIDFVRYAINTTIDTMRFTNVNKTVGGPIDILVITPNKAKWIAHKKLH